MLLGTALALVVGGVAGYQYGADDTDVETLAGRGMGVGAGQQMMQGQFGTVEATDFVSMRPEVSATPVQAISAEEREDLLYMREEEKLARDVYETLGQQWQLPIFSNIAQSEQTHTEAIRDVLTKYAITDPVVDDTIGVFANSDLADLYESLVADGSQSVEAALRVGALIEDLDINDLQIALERTDNEDITLVYENLERGSRNHLRSFVSQLTAYDETYTPSYISVDEYNEIVTSNRETGTGVGGTQRGTRGWGMMGSR